jgi:arylsulfatase A-like enzyme
VPAVQAFLLGLLLAPWPFVVLAQQPPNILLLMAEDLSPRIGAFGDPVAVTPNLDRLASEGVRYTNVYGAAGVCATNRAATIMGMHQESFGAQHMRAYSGPFSYRAVPPPEAKAFPELLRAAGYYTFVTGKLDYQFSGPLPGSGPFTIWDRETWSGDWERPDRSPFFGYMNFGATHESGVFPRWSWPRGIAHMLAQLSHITAHWNTEDRVVPKDVVVPPYYPDTDPIRRDIARHYNNIITMDREVGAVLRSLEAENLVEDTIVIWTTDHGDGLPRAKRELFDSGLHAPMIIRWPTRWRPEGATAGSVDERMISFVDFAPTILSLAGAPIPGNMQGKAFAGPAEEAPRRYVFAARDRIDEVPDRQRAVRDADFKYIRNHDRRAGGFPLAYRDNADGMRELHRARENGALDAVQRQWFEPRPAEYLFDTRADPHEVNNLAEDPLYAEVLDRMRRALDRHAAMTRDYGEMDEAAMAESFWPGGEAPVTAPVSFRPDAGSLELHCETEGASIGYRLGDGPWLLYTRALDLQGQGGATITAKAVRYGWEESDERTFSTPR